MTSRPGWKLATVTAFAVLAGGAPSILSAQQVSGDARADEPVRVLSAGGFGEDLDLSHLDSPFNLRAAGDRAVVGTRSNGQSANCIVNNGMAPYFTAGCGSPQYTRSVGGGYFQMYFDLMMGWTAPPSDVPDVVDASVLGGGGWTFNMTGSVISIQGGSDKIGPSDRGSELLAIGVQTTNDGDCTDFTGAANAFIGSGNQILPVSTCPQTHPPGGFAGHRLAEQEVYLDLFENDPTFAEQDPFAFWRVPDERRQNERTIGDFQAYGEWNDYYFEALPRYGAVVPGQEGDPEYSGWPLGLDVFFNAFYWGLPTVGGSTYWMATIVNNSEEVYGQPVDYDSIYWAIHYDPLIQQQAAQYLDLSRSAILHQSQGDGCALASDPNHPAAVCFNRSGFGTPSAGIVVLKSPLGDLRYKQLSDPESDFFSPGHPLAGDTITIQHRHNCGFGGCYPNTMASSQRASFGLFSSTGANVLDGNAPSEYGQGDATAYWLTFRPEGWPNLTGEFNKYVPGVDDDNPIWDYNHDGVPDTIYADDCGSEGCVGVWSDTLPGGHINYYGNIAAGGIGPFSLAAGDTTGLIIAFVGGADSAGIESTVNNSIEFYQNFFLGPEAAPVPTIVAVDTEIGSVDSASITLFWDNATEDFVDPFLSTLDVSGDAALNPWLEDSVATLAQNNVAALHLFRSCDGGNTFSSDGDCDGDPIDAEDAKFGGFGYEPYQTFEVANGELPNTFTDNAITAGITYTYVLVSETEGAVLNVVRGEEGDLAAELVTFAPKLLSSLSSATSNPNVAAVYVPVNLAGGADRAQVEVLGRTGFADVPIDISVVGSAPEGGTFRTVFVDSVVVEETETIEGGEVVDVSTTVRGLQVRTDTNGEVRIINEFTFTRAGDLATSGLSEVGTEDTETGRVTTFAGGQAFILVNEEGNRPLLASTTLTGSAATPGGFIGREDFPFFSLGVNAAAGGTFAGDFYLDEDGDTLLGRVEPSVGRLSSTTPLEGSQFGTYEMTFAGSPFGPLAPFSINQPGTLAETFTSSIEQRSSASQTTTSAAAIEAVNEAAGLTLSPEDAVAFDLPFSVRNATYDRPVQVVMADHQETITLGQGFDAIDVEVPGNNWVPGDQLYFVEQVEREVTDESGQTVIGQDGQPVTETALVATFSVQLGCTNPRSSCDPTVGGATPSGYAVLEPGTEYFMQYLVPFTGGEEFRFRLDPAVQLTDVEAVSDSALANVHVVPNPYIFASNYERATADRVLKFTNLPPSGMLRIYDVAGRFVQEISYTQDDLLGQTSQGGDLDWDLTTREGLELSYGLYIFVLESDFGSTSGKFVVIR